MNISSFKVFHNVDVLLVFIYIRMLTLKEFWYDPSLNGNIFSYGKIILKPSHYSYYCIEWLQSFQTYIVTDLASSRICSIFSYGKIILQPCHYSYYCIEWLQSFQTYIVTDLASSGMCNDTTLTFNMVWYLTH